ncbi:hypothetical protein NPIL_643081 [Nephila pilipes]|uniref:Uncharacterized protein n=1 Tax=Nephila pilipes TaxID=299642 RepID=A0A8X6QQ45_NEPPI|nr:hypothetical protein NPIL_643081 [Nephila pilipes]
MCRLSGGSNKFLFQPWTVFEMSGKKNVKEATEEKETDSQSSPSSRPLTRSQRKMNVESSDANVASNVRQRSPRFLDRMTEAFGGARPKTSTSVKPEKGKKSKKASKTEAMQSILSVADKFKASQASLASSSYSSQDASGEFDSDSLGAGYSSGKSAASFSPHHQKTKSKSHKLAVAAGPSLKSIFKRSPKQKDESERNLIESEETNSEAETKKAVRKTKKKKAEKFNEYKAVTGNFSKANISRTPSTGPESEPTYTSELDSELSSPANEMAQLQIKEHSSRSLYANKIPSIVDPSHPSTSQGNYGETHGSRATLMRDQSKQRRKQAVSPYTSPRKKCRCKSGFHSDPECPIRIRKKKIHNRKKGLEPPRRSKSKSPSPSRK